MSNCKFQQVPGRSIVPGEEANIMRTRDEKALNERQGGDGVSVMDLMMGGGGPRSRGYLHEKLEPCRGARSAIHPGCSSRFWRAECFVCFWLKRATQPLCLCSKLSPQTCLDQSSCVLVLPWHWVSWLDGDTQPPWSSRDIADRSRGRQGVLQPRGVQGTLPARGGTVLSLVPSLPCP